MENWIWQLKFENWNWKLEWKIEIENWNGKFKLKIQIEIEIDNWNGKFKLKLKLTIEMKRTGTPSFCTLLISVLLLGSNDLTFLEIYCYQRVFKRKGILGAFTYGKVFMFTYSFKNKY